MKTLFSVVALMLAMTVLAANVSAQDAANPPAPVVDQDSEASPSDVTPPPVVQETEGEEAAEVAPEAAADESTAPVVEGSACGSCGGSSCTGCCQPTSCCEPTCRPRRCRVRFCRPMRVRCGRGCGGC